MANFQQPQQSNTFGQYFGYGSGIQYDNSHSQNKWGTAQNAGNQAQISPSQNQQQVYQTAAQNYAAASGFYGNQMYGQQQSYTGSVDNSMNMNGTRNTNSVTGNTANAITGNKSVSSYSNAAAGSTNVSIGTSSYSSGYGSTSAGNFSNNAAENKSGSNTQNQMLGAVYGNANQNTGMNNSMVSNMTSMASNMTVPATSQTQSFGNSVTTDTLGQFNQMSQLFGSGTNYGAYSSGDTSGGNFSAGYNQALNTGMMTLLQQTLMQQASGGAAFGFGTGNTWGMSDSDGGFYAPPVDSNYQSGGEMSSKQGKKGKKWSGKDKQDFYGNRFAQMFTGMPGILGQSQTGAGKGKRLMDGVRFNVKGEKVIDVEIPLSLYSRWGQLRKFFSKQDTEVAKHLLEFHDEMCEDCLEREQRKKKKPDELTEQANAGTGEAVETELSEEDLTLRQVMGFGNFNTTREAMVENNQVDSTTNTCVSNTSAESTTSWEIQAGFIGPQKPEDKPLDSQSEVEKNEEPSLSEEEKVMMDKLGWSVFNTKKNKNGDQIDDEDDDDDDDNVEKMDDGGKDETAAEGQ